MENGTRVKILHPNFRGLKGKVISSILSPTGKVKALQVAYVERLFGGKPYHGTTTLAPSQVKIIRT